MITANLPLLNYIERKDRGTVYPHVYFLLEHYEESRSDDKILVKLYVDIFHNGDYSKAPPIESIVRRRREIQNRDGLFLPSKDVQGRRKAVTEVNHKMYSEGVSSQ